MTDLAKAVEAAKRLLKNHCLWNYVEGNSTFHDDVELTVETMLNLAAPQWQSEPTEEWWYWVEGVEPVCFVYRSDIDESWMIEFVQTEAGTLKSELVWTDLNNRRVCPIGPRPQ